MLENEKITIRTKAENLKEGFISSEKLNLVFTLRPINMLAKLFNLI